MKKQSETEGDGKLLLIAYDVELLSEFFLRSQSCDLQTVAQSRMPLKFTSRTDQLSS